MNENVTILTERGQVSIPASIRRQVGLKPGQLLRWERLSDTEMRVVVDHDAQAQGAFAALGYARRWLSAGEGVVRTDDIVRELREAEED